MIGGILVSLKYLALRGRIEGFDPNDEEQDEMKRFWNIHVNIFIQPTAEHYNLTFVSNLSSSMSSTRKTICPKPTQE